MKVSLNNFDIDISKDKVVIHDPEGKLRKSEALTMLKYLKTEGFITHERIFLEIVDDLDDSDGDLYDDSDDPDGDLYDDLDDTPD